MVQHLIIEKLNSKKGSALLLALLFSLICLLLGVAILTAGVTSNGRIVNAAKAEQAYFIVSSVFNTVDCETRVEHHDDDAGTVTLENFRFVFDVDRASSSDAEEVNKALSGMTYGEDDYDDLRLKVFKPYITSALKDAIVNGQNSKRKLEITMGKELGDDYTYTAQVEMTVAANDYSIYFDVTDILKYNGEVDSEGNPIGESIGLPNLHTIAVQAKSVTPTTVIRTNSGDVWKVIEFEYHRAKYIK